ncbi:RICIN domain-containing protein [Asanoa siamensis]|uniref:Ricin B lectin domain-containing protein n=1 Tax=Asanoa siamensis TaxID=926357 RepID=A0ABQ4D409_9ACTN|nr:hypothetical protein [Asanoa siamensis]GIF78273.1 hypothetical protein Asi02nite_77910 [Asanoa siamensis]
MGKTKVMAVLNAATGNTAPMIQAPWTAAAPDNDWIVVEKESTANVYRLKPLHTYSPDGNVHNDKCLAVKNADAGNNIPIVNATCSYDDSGASVSGCWPVPVSSSATFSGSRPKLSPLGRTRASCPKGRCGTGRKWTAISLRSRPSALPVRSRKFVPVQRQLLTSSRSSAHVFLRCAGSTPSSWA